MNKFILTILIALTLSSHAEETANVAVATVQEAKESNWQNWAFAGTLIVVATGAIIFVAANDGKSAH